MPRVVERAGERCVIYCRTSTEKQETGLDTQYQSCLGFVETYEMELVLPPMEETTLARNYPSLDERAIGQMVKMTGGWFDEGKSGSIDPIDRPSFSSMLDFCKSDEVETIVCYHNDRLARDTETTLRIIRVCKEEGICFMFANIPDLRVETPEDEMLLTNLAMLATYFRRDLARKTKAGMQRLKREGRWLGETPYGFYATTKKDDDETYGVLLYHWGELDRLLKMMTHYVNSTPPTYYGTADFLNSQGLTTRRGKKWTAQHVKNIMTKTVLKTLRDNDGQKFAEFFPDEIMEVN